jgi:WD40 repeat protein
MMQNLFARLRTVLAHDRAIAALAVLCLILAGVLWYVTSSPARGVVSATYIAPEGGVRAVDVELADSTLSFVTNPYDTKAALIAAIPTASGDKVAFLSRTRDGVAHIAVRDTSDRVVPILDGKLTAPRWSQEGTGLAVSELKDEENTVSPNSWTVLRAVTHGDSLPVGQGYQPFPSPNQRTFALTEKGIALLSYSDDPPTIVVASPTVVPVSTPFTVSSDGRLVAWVAPADKSLQIFENVNGYFVPLLLKPGFHAQSLVFSPNGRYLLAASSGAQGSELRIVKVSSGKEYAVGGVDGHLELHTWRYE